jgi:hypothetical protein
MQFELPAWRTRWCARCNHPPTAVAVPQLVQVGNHLCACPLQEAARTQLDTLASSVLTIEPGSKEGSRPRSKQSTPVPQVCKNMLLSSAAVGGVPPCTATCSHHSNDLCSKSRRHR